MAVSGIWTRNEDEGWHLSRPEGFPDEATLHDLIEKTPEMLPLAGAPPLLVLGREVPLGSGYADLLGVEASGRPVIIEIKLAHNNEARRAVVAQILAYAANLHGTTREQLEDRFGPDLKRRGYETLVDHQVWPGTREAESMVSPRGDPIPSLRCSTSGAHRSTAYVGMRPQDPSEWEGLGQ